MMQNKNIALLEIILFISMSISVPSLMRISTGEEITFYDNALRMILILRGMIFSEKGIVSALQQSDISIGVYTCVESKDGKYCQEYPASECMEKCKEACVPSKRDDTAACRVGTCYNTLMGVCSEGTPRVLCQAPLGTWHAEPEENIADCRRGCCLIGGQASFITRGECNYRSNLIGITTAFRPDIHNEYLCSLASREQQEGACTFSNEQGCRRTTAGECGRLGGFFNAGWLCSNPLLNSSCRPQQTTGCDTGKDGSSRVYWFDSCGNRENVYDYVNRIKIQLDGMIIPEDASCSVREGSSPLARAKFCGNCNILDSSICGQVDKSAVASGDFACKSMECTDAKGTKRSHLEAWCLYDSAIGLDASNNRASDTPGSRHFLNVCKNGTVETTACGEFREQICVEAKTRQGSASFSTAACRPNLAKMCILANYLSSAERSNCGDEKECQQQQQAVMREKCLEIPDCFVKNVAIGEEFSFDMCAPKYPPGFILAEGGRGEGAESVCALGSQKCLYVKITGLFDDEIHNEKCITPEFTEKMNDLCMSLGDCGGKVNFKGAYSGSYLSTLAHADLDEDSGKVTHVGPVDALMHLRPGYVTQLISSSHPIFGKVAEPAPEYFNKFMTKPNVNPPGSVFSDATMPSTLLGLGGIAAWAALKTGFFGQYSGQFAAVFGPSVGPAVAAGGAALTGAAMGLALTSFVLDYTGVGRGLPAEATYSLLAAGAAGGALVGYAWVASTSLGSSLPGAASAAVIGIAGLVVVVVVIIIIIILSILGVGDIEAIQAEFICKPWQPPLGGSDCSKCDGNNPPCSLYSCHSLGQTCELINEGTDEVACIDVGTDDATTPLLQPLSGVLPTGHSYTNISERGYSITAQGCLRPYTRLTFGIAASEPSQCRVARNHTDSFDAMPEDDFGVSSLFRFNHTASLLVPDLPSLGYRSFDPNLTASYALYVRCTDKQGNKNTPEYAISFCVAQGPDVSQPFIQWREPSQAFTRSEATTQSVSLYTNEPAECRWDTRDAPYESLLHEMNCAYHLSEETRFGWKCSALFPVNETQTIYYARCLDQPWLMGANESQRNPSASPYRFSLQRSSPLKITSALPEGKIEFGSIPASTEIVVRTEGGADEGAAQCSYQWDTARIPFLHTLSTVHRMTFSLWQEGQFTLPVECKDSVGNTAENVVSFDVLLDNTPPKVTRAYNLANNIQIVTDEPAECHYSNALPRPGEKGCEFAFENGTSMTTMGNVHAAPFVPGVPYYIKCRDRFLWDMGDTCSIILRSSHGTQQL